MEDDTGKKVKIGEITMEKDLTWHLHNKRP